MTSATRPTTDLIHRQGFGQVAGEVGVVATGDGHIVRKQLQRQNAQQGADLRAGFRQHDQVAGVGTQARILLPDCNRAPSAACDLVDAADDHGHIFRADGKQNREALGDGREGSVLELGREHAFAVAVGDLFELQRAFQRHRVGGAVAQAVAVLPGVHVGGDSLHLRRSEGDGLLHQFGDGVQRARVTPGHTVSKVEEGDNLVGEGFSGWHADLVAAAQWQRADGGFGEGGADHIRQPKTLHALFFGSVERVEDVLRLAGLAEEETDILRTDGWQVLRDELRRDHGDHGTAGQAGKIDRPGQAGVVAGAAADEVEVAGLFHFVQHELHIRAASQHMEHFARHLGLLVDLFEHEVGVAALLHGAHSFGDLFGRALDQAAVRDGTQLHAVGPEGDDLAVLDADDGAGEGQDGGQVGRDAGEAFADAHHQPGAFLDGVELVVVDAADDVGVIALQIVVGTADGFDEAQPAVDVALHRVHAGLTVVLRADHEALVHEHLAQLDVVDHVAVVGTDDIAVGVEVGLRVHLAGRAKGSPAQLGDAARAAHLGQVVLGRDVVHPAGVFAQVDLRAADGCRANGVVAAVGEPPRRFDQDRSERLFSCCNDAKYAAHRCPFSYRN